ncbi:hypothetical protein D9M71_649050 [compost metagenome]
MRWPRVRTAWASSASILPMGIPVQPAMTAATVLESTCSGTRGSSWRMASRPASRRASSAARWSMRSSSSSSGLAASALSLRASSSRRASSSSRTASRSSPQRVSSSRMAVRLPVDSFSRAVMRSRWSRPVACSRRRRCSSSSRACSRWRRLSSGGGTSCWARATRAQAVSSTLMALSGNCRPEM